MDPIHATGDPGCRTPNRHEGCRCSLTDEQWAAYRASLTDRERRAADAEGFNSGPAPKPRATRAPVGWQAGIPLRAAIGDLDDPLRGWSR